MKITPFRFFVFAIVGGCSLLLAAQSKPAQYSPVPDRIVAPIDDNSVVPLRGNVHPLAQARFDRGTAPGATPTGSIALVLRRSAAQQQALTQFLQDVQNPASPSFHKWLTPAQYGAQFGPSSSDLQTVQSWLQSHGFKVEKVAQARNLIQFSGNFEQLQSAFHTSIHSFSINGENHLANATDPEIPAALAPVIAGVGPLNDFRPRSNVVRGPRGTWDAIHHAIAPQFTLQSETSSMLYADPADAATMYDTPNKNLNGNFTGTASYDGTGVVIGIAGDADIAIQDVANYRTGFLGETPANVNLPTVIEPGNDPEINGDTTEALLDVEVAGGLAPGAKIDLYTAADTNLTPGLFQAIGAAIGDNIVSILNISFGECESSAGAAGNALFNEYFQQAAAQGISVTVSAGDGGSAGCDNFDTESQASLGLAVNAIASTPYTIAVGGTDFDILPGDFTAYVSDVSEGTAPYYRTAKSYIPENPWNDSTQVNTMLDKNVYPAPPSPTNIIAGGGGASIVYSKPWFQTAFTPVDGTRDLPDVSLLAANGYYGALWVVCADSVADGDGGSYFTDCQNSNGVFVSGTNFEGVGGTSAAAPAFAGMLALVSQAQGGRLGQADSVLYSLAQSQYSTVFHDITVGNNSVYCVSNSPDCLPTPPDCTNKLPDCVPTPLLFLSGYNATAGYDLASGLGSVDVSSLITHWTNSPLGSTTTTLDINGSAGSLTASHGTTLNFSVGVAPTSATGAVAVLGAVGGELTIPLTSGTGTGSYNGLPGGTYTVVARYGGDSNDAASTSSPISVNISPEPSTTTLSVAAYGYSGPSAPYTTTAVPYGSYVFVDAQITGTTEGSKTQGVATGTVEFYDNGKPLTSENIGLNNTASYPALNNNYPLFTVGKHAFTASYAGDASYKNSSAAAVTFTIVKAPTTTAVQATPSTINVTDGSYVAVTVSTPFNLAMAPTGTVTLSIGSTKLATISTLALNADASSIGAYNLTGAALLQAAQLPPGVSTITAAYSGDAHYAASSTTFTVDNTSGVGAFSLSNSGSIAALQGQSASATVTVTPSGGFDGPVSFTCTVPSGLNATCSVPAPVSVNGAPVAALVAVSAAAAATPGTYSITVTGTDDTGKTKASTSFNFTVSAPTAPVPGFTLTNGGSLIVTGGATTGNSASLTLTPVNGYTGTAKIACTVTTSIANPLNPPTCSSSAVNVTGATAVSFSVQISTVAATTAGAYTVNVTATDQASSSTTANTSFPLTVDAPPLTLVSSGNISVSPGATSGNTTAITITPANGYKGTVDLACKLTAQPAGASGLPTCSIPATISISGTNAVSATLTITTNAGTTGDAVPPLKKFFVGGGAALAMILFFGVPARRRAWRALFGLLVAVFLMSGIGCGTGSIPANHSNPGNPGTAATTAGTYTFTVTASDAATQVVGSSTTVTVTVQ
jgi:hypothetical protein